MPKTLLSYQKQGIRLLREKGRAILADDMGLGKTVQGVAAAAEGRNQHILILSPKGLMANWAAEIEDRLPGSGDTISVYNIYKKDDFDIDKRWVIINYESAKMDDKMKMLLSRKWDLIICDEAHKLKNRKTGNFKAVKKLRSRDMYLITGTPMRESPADIWTLLHLLDRREYSSFWRWAERYVIYEDGFFGKTVTGYKNLDQLSAEIAPYIIRRSRESVIENLPEKIHETIMCSMTSQQEKMYNDMLEEYVAELKQDMFMAAPTQISRIMRLRQICTDPTILTEELRPVIGSGKMQALEDLLKLLVKENGEKVIIFSNWSRMCRRIQQFLDSWTDTVILYTGDMTAAERSDAEWRFQNDPEATIFVSTIGAGGVGLTLTAATSVIFMDKAWVPDDNAQAEDRAYARINDLHGACIYSLVSRNTIDELIETYVTEKKAIPDEVLSGVVEHLLRTH